MDSNSPEILPPVHVSQSEGMPSSETAKAPPSEKERPAGEQPGGANPSAQQFVSQSVVAPTAAPTQPVASQGSTPTHTSNLIADDSDLIEKQWVIKAKEIIDKTKHDPRLQNNEINKVRADYMYKRYGKEIKIPEE